MAACLDAPARTPRGNRTCADCVRRASCATCMDSAFECACACPAEYARCGRTAPPALGAGGPTLEHLDEADTELVDAVLILDVTAELCDEHAGHDPIAYILTEGVKFALQASLLS